MRLHVDPAMFDRMHRAAEEAQLHGKDPTVAAFLQTGVELEDLGSHGMPGDISVVVDLKATAGSPDGRAQLRDD